MKKFAAILMVGAMLLSGCSIMPKPEWENQGELASEVVMDYGKAGVLVYRLDAPAQEDTVNVYVGGEYLSSLQQYGYKFTQVCPKKQRVDVSFNRLDPAYLKKSYEGLYYPMQADTINYLKVVADNEGQPALLAVDAEIGAAEAQQTREQTHVLSRIKQTESCDTVLLDHTFNALALFGFDKDVISAEGKAEINALIDTLEPLLGQDLTISIAGHTDPMGTAAYNQKLSERRAKSVAAVFAQRLHDAVKYKVVGYGESQLVNASCATDHPNDRKARRVCDQVNRRVDVSVIGTN